LRLQDYAQGRKTANQFGASTSAGTGFGASTSSNTGFGTFGQQQQQPAPSSNTGGGFGTFGQPSGGPSAFGQPASQTSAFGGGTSSGFGQQPQQPQTGAFGQPATGGFGSTGGFNTASNTSAFGQPGGQTQGAFGSATGAFGQPKPSGFGGFGPPLLARALVLALASGPSDRISNNRNNHNNRVRSDSLKLRQLDLEHLDKAVSYCKMALCIVLDDNF
jgi:hypothetical protein